MGTFLFFLMFVTPSPGNWFVLAAFLFYTFVHECKGD